MSKCKYCNKKVGFFKSKHIEFKQKFLKGLTEINKLASAYFTKNEKATKKELSKIAKDNLITKNDLFKLLANIYDEEVKKGIEMGVFSYELEEKLNNFIKFYQIPDEILDLKDSLSKTVKASILREQMTTGEIFNRMRVDYFLPFVFKRNEQLVYLFNNVDLYEQKTFTKYVGGSEGISLRLAKGLYYRKSVFKGMPIKETALDYTDIGTFALTDKHLYFASSLKNFRIGFDQIISISPHSDGVVI